MEPWTKKYAPASTQEFVGNAQAAARVRAYITSYKRGQKPLLLAGPTGVGKTSCVLAIAAELDAELIEVNASDVRNKDAITSLIGAAATQASLFFRRKIILVDEVDGVSGTSDRGGMPALIELFAKSAHAIICTASDVEIDKLKPLRKAAEIVTLMPPPAEEIAALLERIAKNENVTIAEGVALRIAMRCGGDVRSAVTDLQALATGSTITKEEVDALSERERSGEIAKALQLVLRTSNADIALPAFDLIDEQPDRIMLWIEENVPKIYKDEKDRARALATLADADVLFGRVRRWQYYRYYAYIYQMLSAGIAVAKDTKTSGLIDVKQPSRLLTIWMYNQKHAKRKRLAEQLSPQLHASTKRLVQDTLPYLAIAWKDKKFAQQTQQRYELDIDACEWFAKATR